MLRIGKESFMMNLNDTLPSFTETKYLSSYLSSQVKWYDKRNYMIQQQAMRKG
jgi:hypothetical protein